MTASQKEKCFLDRDVRIIVSCEHAGNAVPEPFLPLFRGYGRMLRSHLGYDIGARELAEFVAKRFGTAIYSSSVTRLLVDLNRSRDNPRRFSRISRRLPASEKESVMEEYYKPYRLVVESEVGRLCSVGRKVLHLSIHTFTPVLDGKVRLADIGLLYDPARRNEVLFCRAWKSAILDRNRSLIVRLNYPYSGRSDGFTAYFRSIYSEDVYLGVELEVNQKHPPGNRTKWREISGVLADSLASTLQRASPRH